MVRHAVCHCRSSGVYMQVYGSCPSRARYDRGSILGGLDHRQNLVYNMTKGNLWLIFRSSWCSTGIDTSLRISRTFMASQRGTMQYTVSKMNIARIASRNSLLWLPPPLHLTKVKSSRQLTPTDWHESGATFPSSLLPTRLQKSFSSGPS